MLYNLCECLRIVSILLAPFLPDTAPAIQKQIGAKPEELTYDAAAKWNVLPPDAEIAKGKALFPRIDAEKELEELNRLIPNPAAKEAEKAAEASEGTAAAQITIDDFEKLDLRAGYVKACEHVKGSKKLLKFTLDDGMGGRTIVSGIAKWYEPENLVGHTVAFVANLKPAKLCGVESQGMILSADAGEDDVKILLLDGVPAGSKIR